MIRFQTTVAIASSLVPQPSAAGARKSIGRCESELLEIERLGDFYNVLCEVPGAKVGCRYSLHPARTQARDRAAPRALELESVDLLHVRDLIQQSNSEAIGCGFLRWSARTATLACVRRRARPSDSLACSR